MYLDTPERALFIIVTVILIVLLITVIYALYKAIQLINKIEQLANKAEAAAEQAGHIGRLIGRGGWSLMAARLAARGFGRLVGRQKRGRRK